MPSSACSTLRAPCPSYRSIGVQFCTWSYVAETRVAGRRLQATKAGFVTKAAAVAARAEALRELNANPVTKRSQTVGDALVGWLARKERSGSLRPATALAYRRHLDAYLVPILGGVKLSELAVRHLDHLQDELQRLRPDMSAATRSRVFATLRSFVRDAYRRGEIGNDPTRRAEPIRAPRPKVKVWQAEQFGRFLDHLEHNGERLAPVVAVAALTGLRRGELCGLRWLDVDLDAGRIVVAQQVVQLGREQTVAAPKTPAGEQRVVDLDPTTVGILRAVQRRQDDERDSWGDAYLDYGLVFTWDNGRPLSPEDLTRRFPKLIRRFNDGTRVKNLPTDHVDVVTMSVNNPAELQRIRDDGTLVGAPLPIVRFHDLRHLQASLLIAAGVPLAVVSKRLGHSSVQVTSDSYGHLLDGVGTAAATAAAALIPRRSSDGS